MKLVLFCWAVLLVTQEIQKSMSQNGEPKIGNVYGYLQYKWAQRGVLGGEVAYIYTYTYIYISCIIHLRGTGTHLNPSI